MTNYINTWNIENELVTMLRNADIFTITQRGVTTRTDSGTYSNATEHLIARNNVRNIRSITVAAVTLTFGKDYQVDYTYLDSGTYKTHIVFTTAQTGAYSIQYDYGTDKIFTDYPQDYVTVSSMPRMVVACMPSASKAGGLGNVNETAKYFAVTVYDISKKDIEGYMALVRKHYIDFQKSFYYLAPVRPHSESALIPGPAFKGQQKVFMKSLELVSEFNYEKN